MPEKYGDENSEPDRTQPLRPKIVVAPVRCGPDLFGVANSQQGGNLRPHYPPNTSARIGNRENSEHDDPRIRTPRGIHPRRIRPATPPTYPTRDPHTPGYVRATELPDATLPPANEDGNFILGPTHPPAPEMTANPAVPQGTVTELTLTSADSKFYPGIARDPGTFGTPDPDHPERLILTTSHPHPWTRTVAVYVPHQYVPGAAAPFIVGADGPDRALFTALDNLIAEHKVPIMIAISIANGGGDAQGSERGLEYDTMSGHYAEWVENEVLPLVESKCSVTLTHDPNGRAAMGGSSGGAVSLIMAWYHPEWYHRVLAYSGTWINQQWPWNPATPHGAWGFVDNFSP